MDGGAGVPVTVRAPLCTSTSVVASITVLALVALIGSGLLFAHGYLVGVFMLPLVWALRRGPLFLPLPVLLSGLALADLARLTGWWPCEVACQGGAHYQSFAGLSVVWPALITHLGLAALAIRDARRGAWCAWTIRLCWFLVGIATFFLIISLQLELYCSYCLMVHFGALLSLCLVQALVPGMRWWNAVAWLIGGWLLANAAFHHGPVADAPATPPLAQPTVTTPATDAVYLRADANRRQGLATAPYRIELVVDFTCSHCAELHGPLLEALKPSLADGRVELITRHLVRQTPALQRELARLTFAAATLGAADYRLAVTTLLGVQRDAKIDSLRARLGETLALAALDAALRDHAPAIERLIDDDQRRVIALDAATKTPSLIVIDRASGAERKRWQGSALTRDSFVELLADIAKP